MSREIVDRFEISSLSILGADGSLDASLEPALSSSQLKKIFEGMIRMREFDQRGIAMQRQGRMGTYAPALGQEAVHLGTAAALQSGDWAVPSFREQGVLLARGVRATTMFLFFMGSEEGNRYPRSLHTLPYSIPCASQLLHAVGIGMAAQYKKDPTAILTYFGDGATSEGDFHEAMNFAAVYKSPVVFVCQNNQWAISTPRAMQSHSQTLAQKAVAYGFEGLQADGNDVLAVYSATEAALRKARACEGPTMLEFLTYRMGVHTTADDPNRYRDEKDLEIWAKKDPIARFEKYLLNKGVLKPGDREAIAAEISEQLKRAAEEAEEICQSLSPDEMFTYMYREMPATLKTERAELLANLSSTELGDKAHAGKP